MPPRILGERIFTGHGENDQRGTFHLGYKGWVAMASPYKAGESGVSHLLP